MSAKPTIHRIMWAVLCLLFICLIVVAQDAAEPGETPVINFRYESWRLSRPGDTVVYHLYGAPGAPDRLERKLLKSILDRYTYQIRTYLGERLVEEKTATISLRDMSRKVYPSELRKTHIEMSTSREIFKGSVYNCQRLKKGDGSVEILSQKIPLGGLMKRLDAAGRTTEEVIEVRQDGVSGPSVSQIKKEVIKSPEAGRSAFSVSELLRKSRAEKKGIPATRKGKTAIVIGNIGEKPVETHKAQSFIQEVKMAGGKPSELFSSKSALLLAGFNHLHAVATYRVSESLKPENKGTPTLPRKITITYLRYIRPIDEKRHAGLLFSLASEDGITTREIPLQPKPYHDMEAFELPPEAVTIMPGTFNCFHIRLVLPTPLRSTTDKGDNRIVTQTDKKIDYWITNIKGREVVAKKIETVKKRVTETAIDNPAMVISTEESTRSTKCTLVDFNPEGYKK